MMNSFWKENEAIVKNAAAAAVKNQEAVRYQIALDCMVFFQKQPTRRTPAGTTHDAAATGSPLKAAMHFRELMLKEFQDKNKDNDADEATAPVVFSTEVNTRGSRAFGCIVDWEHMLTHVVSRHTVDAPPNYYEVIHPDSGPVRLAFPVSWNRGTHDFDPTVVLPQLEQALAKYLADEWNIRDLNPGTDFLVTKVSSARDGEQEYNFQYTVPAVTLADWHGALRRFVNEFVAYIQSQSEQAGISMLLNGQNWPALLTSSSGQTVLNVAEVYKRNYNWLTLGSFERQAPPPTRVLKIYRRSWIPETEDPAVVLADSERDLFAGTLAICRNANQLSDKFPERHPLTMPDAGVPASAPRGGSTSSSDGRRILEIVQQREEAFLRQLKRKLSGLSAVDTVRIHHMSVFDKDPTMVIANFGPCPFGDTARPKAYACIKRASRTAASGGAPGMYRRHNTEEGPADSSHPDHASGSAPCLEVRVKCKCHQGRSDIFTWQP